MLLSPQFKKLKQSTYFKNKITKVKFLCIYYPILTCIITKIQKTKSCRFLQHPRLLCNHRPPQDVLLRAGKSYKCHILHRTSTDVLFRTFFGYFFRFIEFLLLVERSNIYMIASTS